MALKPLGNKVIVEVTESIEKTKGGIVLPDTAKEKPQEAKVIAVGPGKMLPNGKIVQLEVKAGDKILFGKYSGTEVKYEGKEYLIINDDDILGILK